jgi:hypothetical protein
MFLVTCAVGSFVQARDTARGEEEEERADSNLGNVTIKSRKKGVASSTKIRGCIHKKISGLEQKAKKVPRVFFKNWCSGT